MDILVVDDVQENLQVLNQILKERGYKVRLINSGKGALGIIMKNAPDLILLDITMPDMNGYEVCQKLKEDVRFREIPIIFISALTETFDKVKAFKIGGVDYITKPFQAEEVLARIETHLKIATLQYQLKKRVMELEVLADKQVKNILEQQNASIYNLAQFAQMLDNGSDKHLDRISSYCHLLAKQLKSRSVYSNELTDSFLEDITFASRLYDVGKLSLPSSIVLKSKTDKLTPNELEIMKSHTILAADMLKSLKKEDLVGVELKMLTDITSSHHEKWDGTGYPNGLKSTNIPLSARIVSIADVYDAFITNKCHVMLSHDKVVQVIRGAAFTYFDPIIVDAFIQINEKFFDTWDDNH